MARFRIGYRTIKTAVGVAIAISLAQLFGLNSFPSAGIITILCIQVTKKKSIRAAFSRFVACMIAMAYSSLFFELIGYNPLVIGLMLLVFIPTVVMVGVQEGVVTSSVIILHIYSAGNVQLDLLLNETGLITIGITVALLMNMYMPSNDKQLTLLRDQIEQDFTVIFSKLALYLRESRTDWDGEELMDAVRNIKRAKLLAFRNLENHMIKIDDLYYQYFKMREKQLESIEEMISLVSRIPNTTPFSGQLADFIDDLAQHVHPYNTSHIYLGKLNKMKSEMEKMILPETREEFHIQASLYSLIDELEKYLILKSVYKGLSRDRKGMKKAASI
ncbi:MAG: aromatic acid exporter family protein [Bacillus sp. (in: firmicutes)]